MGCTAGVVGGAVTGVGGCDGSSTAGLVRGVRSVLGGADDLRRAALTGRPAWLGRSVHPAALSRVRVGHEAETESPVRTPRAAGSLRNFEDQPVARFVRGGVAVEERGRAVYGGEGMQSS